MGRMPRSRPTVGDPYKSFELTLSDVYLITRDASGEVALPHLGVVIDQLGMTVTKADGAVAAVFRWDDLQGLRTAELVETPNGGGALVVEVDSYIRTHRFVVPTDDPGGLEVVIAELAASRLPEHDTDVSFGRKRGRKRGR
jgi:hypothetical protein